LFPVGDGYFENALQIGNGAGGRIALNGNGYAGKRFPVFGKYDFSLDLHLRIYGQGRQNRPEYELKFMHGHLLGKKFSLSKQGEKETDKREAD
jgi:hypothetical protein